MNEKPINILMIDDDEEDYMIISDIVDEIDHSNIRIDWVSTYEEGLNNILEKNYDLYLIDYRLGKDTGLDLISEAIKAGCVDPLILLTGQDDYSVDMAAMKAGASDYLIKGSINAQLLERSIRYSIANSNHMKAMSLLNAELEERVKSRTLILEQTLDDLETSQKELKEMLEKEKELNELKSRFVSTVSHEFRTPLAVILSSLSLISKYGAKGDVDSQNKHIKKIEQSIINLTDLLNDLLSISEQEEGKVSLNPELLNIIETTTDVIDEIEKILKPGQKIVYQHKGIDKALLSRKVFKHILMNLVSNATKFSGENTSIHVLTDIDQNQLQLSVQDEGIGISEADQEHLFERFFRGENAGNIKGTGLGLNIINGYIKMMKGSAKINSTLGKGTTISIHLPL